MFTRLILLLAPALLIAAAPERIFTIGGEAFSQSDILDARMMPSLDGLPTVSITFSDPAAKRFTALTAANIRKNLTIKLDGVELSSPMVLETIEGNAAQISGNFTVEEAIKLAKQISGKDPVPESLDDGP
jgi:SecD/SecF fusion protein